MGRPVTFAVREAGGHEAEELVGDGPMGAVLGGCPETCFGGVRRAGSRPISGREPAYATLNVADWQGSAPPPYDPLGFRAGFGAAEDGAASGTSSTYAPMAVLRRSAKPRLAIAAKPVARDPARLGAGPLGSRGRSPSSAPPGTREVWPRRVCWLPANTGREPAPADALEARAGVRGEFPPGQRLS